MKYILWMIGLLAGLSLWAQNTAADCIQKELQMTRQEAPIPEVLRQVSAQCGCYFSYPGTLFTDSLVDIEPFTGSVDQFLHILFQDSLVWQTYANQIILGNRSVEKTVRHQPNKAFLLQGCVFDADSKEPLPFVSIALPEMLLGTCANANGAFSLMLSDSLKTKILQFSAMGYETKELSLSEVDTTLIIYLSAVSIPLQEVVVRSVGVSYILAKMQENIAGNYRQTAYSYQSFYREYSYEKNNFLAYAEALFQGYSPTHKRYAQDMLVLEKARTFRQLSEEDSLLVKLKGGIEACLQLDIVQSQADFLAKEAHNSYRYQLVDIRIWEGEMVYVLGFEPKEGLEGVFQGELYITFSDFALLGASFAYTDDQLDYLKNSLLQHKAYLKVKPRQYTYSVHYAKVGGKYHLQHVQGDIAIVARKRSSLWSRDYGIRFEMQLTQMDTIEVQRPAARDLIQSRRVFSEQVPYAPRLFWGNTFVIQPEQEILEAIRASGFQMDIQE